VLGKLAVFQKLIGYDELYLFLIINAGEIVYWADGRLSTLVSAKHSQEA